VLNRSAPNFQGGELPVRKISRSVFQLQALPFTQDSLTSTRKVRESKVGRNMDRNPYISWLTQLMLQLESLFAQLVFA